MKNKLKILLTGGSGFIGRNIKESYLAAGYDIATPRSSELNLIDSDSVDKFFRNKNFDIVLHAATKPGHRNAKDPTNLFYSNVRMFENLARYKDKYGKFINFGSGAIYDNSKDIKNAKETDIFKNIPQDEHGFCKYVVAKRIEKLDNFTDLNIFGIFGKYEDWEIRFISNAICKTLFDLPITLKQNRRFDYLFIDDLMPILEYFIENDAKHKSYNIVPDEKTELIEAAKIIQKINGKNLPVKIEKQGIGFEYTGDNAILKSELKNIRFTGIQKAILTLYNYYMEQKHLIDKNKLLADK
ncbi:MAG: NAD-dependent epimerase/dehydratase family protein [Elusimicrobiota bacterium]|jgi:GDP-L-fucose synthase|nr:NAD-dependent epimerase/dehydratase family protein [Elusimicrobiota bacterium]